MPTDAATPSWARMRLRSRRAISTGPPMSSRAPETSRKASSTESCSTSGVTSRSIDMIRRDTSLYLP
jgi:hypothetical protein